MRERRRFGWAKRLLVVAAVSLGTAALVAPGAWSAALATDVVPLPEAPRPVNVLPSTVRGTLPLTGVPGSQQYLATMLYSYARTPEFWAAAARVNAGTATAGEIELVQQRNGTYSVPATRTQTLTKVVGGVGTAITGYSLGAYIGSSTLDLIGYDAQGAVCRNTTGFVQDVVAVLTGQDCSAWADIPDTFIPNEEVTAGEMTSGGCNGTGGYSARSTTSNPTLEACNGGIFWQRARNAGGKVGPWYQVGYVYVTAVRPGDNAYRWEVDYRVEITGTVVPGVGGPNQSEFSQVYAYCMNPSGVGVRPGYPSYAVHTLAGANANGPGNHTGVVDFSSVGTCTGGLALDFRTRTWTPDPYTDGDPGDQVIPDLRTPFFTWDTELVPPTVSSGDPLRTLRCVVAHSGGTLTRDSAVFRETEGIVPQVLCPDIEGLVVESVQVLNVNLDDGSWTVLYEESTTDEYQAVQTLAPECSAGTCLLDLRKEGASCFQAPSSCAAWFTDPNKASKYSCHYGTHAVDLAECTIYAPSFEPGATTTGNTYGDPDSGVAVTNPSPTAGSDPDGSGEACWPSGWAAFNPLEWFYRPMTCALRWAFVPRAEVIQATGLRVQTAWADTLPAQAPAIVNGWIAQLPDDLGGCEGPEIDLGPALEPLGIEGVEPQHPLSACEEPWSTIAGIANAVLTGSVIIGGALAIVRYFGATIGFVGLGKGQGGSS